MDKLAQKRKWRHEIREKVDIFGRGAEALSPTFAALMGKLRETDEKIRASLLEEGVKLKDVLKSAKQNLNRREYIQAVADISTFHEKLESVADILKNLDFDVDAAHHEFLETDVPAEAIQKLKNVQERIRNKKNKKAAQKVWINKIEKRGGLSDLWYALKSDRGGALRGWEKRYPSKMKALKNQTAALINKSEFLFGTLLSSLKEMSSARGARNLDRYLSASKKFVGSFNLYDTQYEKYYADNIDGFLEKLVAKEKAAAVVEESKKVKTPDTGLGEQSVTQPGTPVPSGAPAASQEPSENYFVPSVRPLGEYEEAHPDTVRDLTPPSHTTDAPQALSPGQLPTISPPKVLEVPLQSGPPSNIIQNPTPEELYKQVQQRGGIQQALIPTELKDTQRSQELVSGPKINSPGSTKLNNFISTLEVLSNENPEILALEINKFAKSIQATNYQTSLKLFAIVEKILDGK